VPDTRQVGLWGEREHLERKAETKRAAKFQSRDPREIFVGSKRLDEYLTENEAGWVVRLREELERVDFSMLEKAYGDQGRRPFHPRVMVGLIVYGMLIRQWSLRELQNLAVRDVGAWFICGGHQPDHSTLGKFLVLHRETLGDEFFASLTRQLVMRLGTQGKVAAIDGTVIEAASSRFRLLKAEAVREIAREAVAAAGEKPDDEALGRKAREAQAVAEIVTAREQKRKAKGRKSEATVVPEEQEAVMQPRKDGVARPSYKPSVLVDETGLILAQRVDLSSETAVVSTLLDRAASATGRAVETALMDAGYFSVAILRTSVERDLDVLCPPGKTHGSTWDRAGPTGLFGKSRFAFDEENNVYRCPAGQARASFKKGTEYGLNYQRYATKACGTCPLKSQCTKGAGRSIKRYEGDDLKDAMLSVFNQPAARAVYQRRQIIVEPIFAELRERQGLRRFHRRGLSGVRLEFSLHCIALNLKRTMAGIAVRLSLVFVWSVRFGTAQLVLAVFSLSREPGGQF
jgi:transposase